MPIGRVENLRVEEGKLIGTPVFDENDSFAKQIASKWENGFLRMASAGLEIVEKSADPGLILAGQIRETVTRSKLIEVSIVDIGGNDEALQLYEAEGKLLKLASCEDAPGLPLLKEKEPDSAPEGKIGEGEGNDNHKNKRRRMTKEQLRLLGLPESATEEQATAALTLMKGRADNASTIELAAVTQAVDQAVAERRILGGQREHYIKLGKAAGIEMLRETLGTLPAQQKPTEIINLGKESAPGGGESSKSYAKLSQVPEAERLELRKSNKGEYMRLFKAEYGVECPELED